MILPSNIVNIKKQTLVRKKFLEGRKISKYVNVYERDQKQEKHV